MTNHQSAKRDRRVELALKWYHLDNLDVQEIQERFEELGHGSFTRSTIYDYLNEAPKEEIIEQIEVSQAEARVRIVDRYERLYKRARESEFASTTDEKILAVVPVTSTNDLDKQVEVNNWEFITPGETGWPDWAEERDTIVRILPEKRWVDPGERYVVSDMANNPVYKQRMVGVRRNQPDLIGQRFAREEQREHLEAEVTVLGLGSTDAEDRQADALEEIADGLDLTLTTEEQRILDEVNDVEPETMTDS